MYKILHNDTVIDIQTNLVYLRYLPRSKKVVRTDKLSANCIYSSDKTEIYAIQGRILPVLHPYKEVIIEECADHSILSYNLVNTPHMQTKLEETRRHKIEEFNELCKKSIVSGVDVTLDNQTVRFELTVEDQLNLNVIKTQVLEKSLEAVVYHAKGEPCRVFSKQDILKVIDAAERHIQYHTTYFNLWKYCINNMFNVSAINVLKYGESLPDEQQLLLDMVTRR